ncbi:uncharacterized protein LOC118459464 [Anopheles albimanus]|uniref:uncharacterized protein LOC118459464 n=1 Tax=Anopheles albimanus TaxID=7167 RepID=UPI0016406DE7|nr:uncharacterized protein LOC118459464 [Anopheles albimanus]
MSSESEDAEESSLEESESETECYWNEENADNPCNYTSEVEQIIHDNLDISTANAIKLNQQFQQKLKLMRTKLQAMVYQCQERLRIVERKIDDYYYQRSIGEGNSRKLGKARVGGYICGQPFFKDHSLYPGPHNEDYLYRKNVMKEFFPLDLFEVTDTMWTVNDKLSVKNAVAAQAKEFLARELSLQAKQCNNPRKSQQIRQDQESLEALSVDALWAKACTFDGSYGGETFTVDWLQVSNVAVSQRHTPAACEGMWNNYLRPGIRRVIWEAEEESLLEQACQEYGYQDWEKIAQRIEGRSQYQCLIHFQANLSAMAKNAKMPWTAEEDQRLIDLVEKNRIGKDIVWNKVVENMPYRNKTQVYTRYMFTLKQPLRNIKFSPEEDCVIIAYVQRFGENFRFFPDGMLLGRTTRQIQARYRNTLRYVNKRATWSLEEDQRLMDYIENHRPELDAKSISWADCANSLGNHSRFSCRTRYYTIARFLEKNPGAKLEDVPRRDHRKLSTTVTNENWAKIICSIQGGKASNMGKAQKGSFYTNLTSTSERSLYEKMKFCYRYSFGNRLKITMRRKHVFTGAKILLHLLEGFYEQVACSKTVATNKILEQPEVSRMFTVIQSPLHWYQLEANLRDELKLGTFRSDALFCWLPPSYNTVIGLRGVCLNANSSSINQLSPEMSLKEPNEQQYQEATKRFVDRFRKIFHWTILLTMLNYDHAIFREEDHNLGSCESETEWELSDDGAAAQEQLFSLPLDSDASIQQNHEPLAQERVDRLVPISFMHLQQEQATLCEAPSAMSSVDVVQNITIVNPNDLPQPTLTNLHTDNQNLSLDHVQQQPYTLLPLTISCMDHLLQQPCSSSATEGKAKPSNAIPSQTKAKRQTKSRGEEGGFTKPAAKARKTSRGKTAPTSIVQRGLESFASSVDQHSQSSKDLQPTLAEQTTAPLEPDSINILAPDAVSVITTLPSTVNFESRLWNATVGMHETVSMKSMQPEYGGVVSLQPTEHVDLIPVQTLRLTPTQMLADSARQTGDWNSSSIYLAEISYVKPGDLVESTECENMTPQQPLDQEQVFQHSEQANAVPSNNTEVIDEETIPQETKIESDKCDEQDRYDELLTQIDDSFSAVDIIRMLNDRRKADGNESSNDSDL